MSLLYRYSHCYRTALTVLLLLFHLPIHAALGGEQEDTFSIVSEPEWIEPINFDPAKSPTTTQPVQYLLVDYQTKINALPYTQYIRYASKALNSTGVEEVSQIKIAYNPTYQELKLHKIYLHRSGGTKDLTHSSKVRFLQREERLDQKIQDGIIDALIDISGTRKQDIVEYSFSIVGRNPIFGEKVFGSGPLSWGADVDLLNLRLISDQRPLTVKTHGTDKKMEKRRVDKQIEYRYLESNIKGKVDERDYPHYETPYAWYEYSEYKTWGEVNLWAKDLYRFSDDNNQNTRNLAKDISEKHNDVDEYALASLSYVQNQIRYLGLEFGVNSHLPRKPDLVIENQYGDCKDKSVLLQKLLKEKQITSYPALVSTSFREGVETRLPSPGAFDHVINLVEVNGEIYWLDGTRTYQAGSLSTLGEDDYGYALVVGHPKKNLMRMYSDGIEPDVITYDESISSTDFDEDVIYTVDTTYTGNVAEFKRYQFENISAADIQKKYLDMYRYYYSDIYEYKNMEYSDNKADNVFVTKEFYKIPKYWDKNSDFVTSSINILSFTDILREPEVRERETDFFLRKPIRIKHSYRLQYPEEVLLNLDGEDVNKIHDSFEFNASHSYNEKLYEFNAELRTLKHVVENEHFQAYLNLLKELKDQWYFSLTVKNPEAIHGYRELIKLRKRLVELSGDAL